jgi:hypothetical protein
MSNSPTKPNPSLKSFFHSQMRQQVMDMVNQTALEQATQMFVDLYMSPGDMSDAPNRLGRVVDTDSLDRTIDSTSFPPYGSTQVQGSTFAMDTATGTNFPVRAGGFKSINDKINSLQVLYRTLTGQVRTKITEWDISLYIQSGAIDRQDMRDYTLLYHLGQDNPGRYRDPRALAFGNLNGAISSDPSVQALAWNPTADPDLAYWRPPTDNLTILAYPPPPYWTYTVEHFLWWSWKRPVLVYPERPVLTAFQQEEVHLALDAGWDTWYPPYWKLFFLSQDLFTMSDADRGALTAGGVNGGGKDSWWDMWSNAGSRTSRARNATKGPVFGPNGPASNTVGQSTGINLKSPIFYGHPYGLDLDPRSIGGYLANTAASRDTPKFIALSSREEPVNKGYEYQNPSEGIDILINGWTSQYIVVEQKQSPEPVTQWVQSSSNGDGWQTISITDNDGNITTQTGYYQTIFPTITVRTPTTRTERFPNAIFNAYLTQESKNKLWWTILNLFIPVGQAGARHVRPDAYFRIDTIGGVGSWSLPKNNIAPVFFFGADKKTMIQAPIEYLPDATREETRTARILWWSWNYTVNVADPHWRIYLQDAVMYTPQIFTPPSPLVPYSPQTDARPISPVLPAQLAANGGFQGIGLWFSIPSAAERGLTSTDNLFTSKWTSTLGTTWGPILARGLTTGLWDSNSRGVLGVPLLTNMAILKTALTPVYTALAAVTTVITDINTDVFQRLLSALETDTQYKPEIQQAKIRFSSANVSTWKAKLLALADPTGHTGSLDKLFTMIDTAKTSGEAALTLKFIQDFRAQHTQALALIQDPYLSNMLESYIHLLYEWRMVILKKRINKVDGTLVQVARHESALGLMSKSIYQKPDPLKAAIKEDLEVVYTATNLTLAMKAYARQHNEVLPVEQIARVYVPVKYTTSVDSSGNPIPVEPTAGTYQLLSREFLDSTTIAAVAFPINFTAGDPNRPPIVQNVISRLNSSVIQQVMMDPNLTAIEKICAARELQDWWQIDVPARMWPAKTDYVNELHLILQPTQAEIQAWVNILSTPDLNPILEVLDKPSPGSTIFADLDVAARTGTTFTPLK